MQVEPPALCHWWNLRPLSRLKPGRRSERRTMACKNLFPEINTVYWLPWLTAVEAEKSPGEYGIIGVEKEYAWYHTKKYINIEKLT